MILTKKEILELIETDIDETQTLIDNLSKEQLNTENAVEYKSYLLFTQDYISKFECATDIEEDKNLSFKNS